jgi:4-amino-4-deoxy-L-arabinose transferase-like glycosyltransferase
LLPLLVAALVYAPALDNGFSLDDYNWLERAVEAGESPWSFIWAREPGQLLNPLPRALLLLWVQAFSTSPLPFHLAVLVLHLVNVGLVGRLGARLSGRVSGFLASLLFALLPSFHEAVFWLAAFFHPLTATLYLCALLALLSAEGGKRGAALLFVGTLTLTLLTKALGFALLPALVLYLLLRRETSEAPWRRYLVLSAMVLGVLIASVNLHLGVRDSYLIERGYYSVGSHWPGNLWAYFARLGWPVPELTAELTRGVMGSSANGVLLQLGAAFVIFLVVASLWLGDWRSRWWAGQLVFCLLPVLPFVFEPASRYLYLAAVPLTLMIASLTAPSLESLWHRSSRDRRILIPLAVVLLIVLLACWAELRLVDNRYEYRERQMSQWVEQVADLVPPEGVSALTIVGLPTLAIDPGIHFEAALRLRWSRPDFELRLVDDEAETGSASRGSVLIFDGTGFRRPQN